MKKFCFGLIFLASLSTLAHINPIAISENKIRFLNRLVFWHFAGEIDQLGFTPTIEENMQNVGSVFVRNSVQQDFHSRRNLLIRITNEVSVGGEMTIESHLITLCHEIGHILGEEPKFKNNKLKLWSSLEPAADDWAMRKCIMEVLKSFPSRKKAHEYPEHFIAQCSKVYEDEADFVRCAQAMEGIAFHATYFNSRVPKSQVCAIDKQESTMVDRTKNVVSNQCRIDTMRGALLQEPKKRCWYAG